MLINFHVGYAFICEEQRYMPLMPHLLENITLLFQGNRFCYTFFF